jgi:hypothetical protein
MPGLHLSFILSDKLAGRFLLFEAGNGIIKGALSPFYLLPELSL